MNANLLLSTAVVLGLSCTPALAGITRTDNPRVEVVAEQTREDLPMTRVGFSNDPRDKRFTVSGMPCGFPAEDEYVRYCADGVFGDGGEIEGGFW